MICGTAVYASSSAAHPVYYILIRNVYVDGIIHFLFHLRQLFIKSFCLRNRSWKTIQHKAVFTVFFLNSVHHKRHCQLIRHQSSLIHKCLCFLSKLCAFFDIHTKNVPGGNMRYLVFIRNLLRLCAFPGSRRP